MFDLTKYNVFRLLKELDTKITLLSLPLQWAQRYKSYPKEIVSSIKSSWFIHFLRHLHSMIYNGLLRRRREALRIKLQFGELSLVLTSCRKRNAYNATRNYVPLPLITVSEYQTTTFHTIVSVYMHMCVVVLWSTICRIFVWKRNTSECNW